MLTKHYEHDRAQQCINIKTHIYSSQLKLRHRRRRADDLEKIQQQFLSNLVRTCWLASLQAKHYIYDMCQGADALWCKACGAHANVLTDTTHTVGTH